MLIFIVCEIIILSLIIRNEIEVNAWNSVNIQHLDVNELKIEGYLKKKESPLAEHVEYLLSQKHWRLLIAISAIESQFCKRKIAYNCWGVGGDAAYRHYTSYPKAIKDANDLIERWQQRGRWLTINDMNGHYVVPKNQNWVNVVNQVLRELQ